MIRTEYCACAYFHIGRTVGYELLRREVNVGSQLTVHGFPDRILYRGEIVPTHTLGPEGDWFATPELALSACFTRYVRTHGPDSQGLEWIRALSSALDPMNCPTDDQHLEIPE